MRENSNPPIKIWSNGSDAIGISLIANSAFSMSWCSCLQDSRSPNSRTLAPSGYTMVHMTISHDHKLTPSGLRGLWCINAFTRWFSDRPNPDALFSDSWPPLRLVISGSDGSDLFWIQRLRLNREIAFRDFGVLDVKRFWHCKVPNPDPRYSDEASYLYVDGPDLCMI